MTTIKLGQTVKDVVTGFTGVATQRVDFQNGNIQFAVQGKVKEDGAFPQAHYIDHHMLDAVDDGVSARVTPVTDTIHVSLGDRVRDMTSGMQGIATSMAVFLNGCVYFNVQPEKRKDGLLETMPDLAFVELKRLEVVVSEAEKMPQSPIAANNKKPGGPSSMVKRRAVSTIRG